jgi:uncharacterized protein (DUF169 family)
MIDLKIIHANAKEIREKLSLSTYPLAIKMVKDEEEIPKDAIRPFKDRGYHLYNCQAFSMSRRGQKMVAMTKEDMWCMEPFVGYGFVEPSKEWHKAKHRTLLGINPEARQKAVQSAPRFKVGEYMGIISAPLEKCCFEPDMFLIYCDPYQLTHILLAKDCIDGGDVTCTLSGHNACVLAVVPVLQNRKCWVTSPCRGDRSIAMAQSNEVIFSAPIERLREFVKSFRYLEEHGQQIPFDLKLHPEGNLKDGYAAVGRTMGIPYEGVTN